MLEKLRIPFLVIIGLCIFSISIAKSDFDPVSIGKQKISEGIRNQDSKRLSTIAVTSMPLILALKEKLNHSEK